MLECEGFKMFDGVAKIPLGDFRGNEMTVVGTWLYNPEQNMWFVGACSEFPFGSSFDKIEIVKDFGEKQ